LKKTVFHFLQPFLSGDLNTRIGNAEIHYKIGGFGKPVTNTNGFKLRDFATYNNMKIMNLLYKYECILTYTWSACNSKTHIDIFIENRKLLELFLDLEFTEELVLVQITF
jgi:hypothetical protein